MKYDDEILMAYADGELDPARRAEIDAAIAKDPALARRVEQQRALRARLAGAFAKVLDQPVPERLDSRRARRRGQSARGPRQRAAVSRAQRASARARRGARANGLRWRRACFSACCCPGACLRRDSDVIEAGKDGLLARGELARALEQPACERASAVRSRC